MLATIMLQHNEYVNSFNSWLLHQEQGENSNLLGQFNAFYINVILEVPQVGIFWMNNQRF